MGSLSGLIIFKVRNCLSWNFEEIFVEKLRNLVGFMRIYKLMKAKLSPLSTFD